VIQKYLQPEHVGLTMQRGKVSAEPFGQTTNRIAEPAVAAFQPANRTNAEPVVAAAAATASSGFENPPNIDDEFV
jgi:hypothetical protein